MIFENMKRYLLCLSYDGSSFYGWQKQPFIRTVQGELETALGEIAKTPVKTAGSSRTDTGVHAICQFSHFDFPIDMTPRQMRLALSSKLPKDIKINQTYTVDSEFHSRFQAVGRSYRFEITKELTPFNRRYKSYFPRYQVNTDNIRSCLHLFKGKNNFEYFSRKDENLVNYLSEIKEIDFVENDEDYIFSITADRFLHNMVRRIVGTMVKLSTKDDLKEIINQLLSKNRDYLHLVYTAPPQGLYLTKVFYPETEKMNWRYE